jgi:hypothetical protein
MLTTWLLLSALTAAPAPPSQDQSIIVTGSRRTHDAVAQYVDSITSRVDGQIARFGDPICPASFGLPAAYNGVIEERLREDAARAGLRVAGRNCDANVVLIVADEPGPLMNALRRERPQMFNGLELRQIQQVLATTEPVRTWQAIEPRGSDGRPLKRIMFFGERPVGGNGAWVNPAASNSRIQQNVQADLVSSFVVIAASAVDGLTLTQIADYAAMRALAKTRTPAGPSAPTILALLDQEPGSARVSELTSWDLAYLRSLYLTDNALAAHSQESAITGAMQRELRRPPDE